MHNAAQNMMILDKGSEILQHPQNRVIGEKKKVKPRNMTIQTLRENLTNPSNKQKYWNN